jgi:inosose dehydratase
MQLGYHSITWGGVTGDAVGVTSLKDLVYRVPCDMDLALRDIAAAGYAGVEMFDGNVLDFAERPGDLRSLLDETGLTLVSIYTGASFIYPDSLPDELSRIRRAAAAARQFGAGQLVVGGGARRTTGNPPEDWDRLASALDAVAGIAVEHGLSACYHPHLGTIGQTPDEVNKVFASARIGFCPDTAHLAAGGGDPETLIRRYRDRIQHVHLKDLDPATGAFLPLGHGKLDFAGILAALRETGYDGWLITELDYYNGDPAEAARISKSFLDRALT